LTSCVSNAGSVKNKLIDLHCLLYDCGKDNVCITETWLYDGFPDSLLDPEGLYNIARADRLTTTCGGVCLMLRDSIDYKQVEIRTNNRKNLELSFIDVVSDSCTYRIILAYRRPVYDDAGVQYIADLLDLLKERVMLVGL
jgi:hypothetical protein